MKKELFYRLGLLALLFLLFLVPLSMIKGLAWEREARGKDVVADIARSTFEGQVIAGPVLVLPYRRTVRWMEMVGTGNDRHGEWRTLRTEDKVLVPPDSLDIQGRFQVETRARQLYEARLLHNDLVLAGRLTIPSRNALFVPGEPGQEVSYEWLPARLVLGVADTRGIRTLSASFGTDELSFVPGTGLGSLPVGVMAGVPVQPGADVDVKDFRVVLSVSGTESVEFLPAGQRTEVRLAGDWPHPSFFGKQLPVAHSESDAAFNATWQTSHFANGLTAAALAGCEEDPECRLASTGTFGVRVVDPVDRYLMTDRTLKYASLFIMLTFGACFLVEVMKRVRVHPVQYMLVGAAQALFFLLVLALAEHLAFPLAYGIASVAIVALLGYYASAILAGWRRGSGFAAIVATLYAVLYLILQSEDTALLLGTLGLLVALSVVMVLTRRIDWYRFGEAPAVETN